MLRFVLNFEFWSFEFVSDFGFSALDLVAAERSEAAPSPLWLWEIRDNPAAYFQSRRPARHKTNALVPHF